MLESGESSQLDSWFEYYQIEPWGDEQKVTSTGFARLLNAIKEESVKFRPGQALDKSEMFQDDFLMLKLRKKQPTKKDRLSRQVDAMENMEPI